MSKVIRNGWKQWTEEELQDLRTLARLNLPKEIIGLKMGRTPAAVAQRAWQERISLFGRRTRRQTIAGHADQEPAAGGDVLGSDAPEGGAPALQNDRA